VIEAHSDSEVEAPERTFFISAAREARVLCGEWRG